MKRRAAITLTLHSCHQRRWRLKTLNTALDAVNWQTTSKGRRSGAKYSVRSPAGLIWAEVNVFCTFPLLSYFYFHLLRLKLERRFHHSVGWLKISDSFSKVTLLKQQRTGSVFHFFLLVLWFSDSEEPRCNMGDPEAGFHHFHISTNYFLSLFFFPPITNYYWPPRRSVCH